MPSWNAEQVNERLEHTLEQAGCSIAHGPNKSFILTQKGNNLGIFEFKYKNIPNKWIVKCLGKENLEQVIALSKKIEEEIREAATDLNFNLYKRLDVIVLDDKGDIRYGNTSINIPKIIPKKVKPGKITIKKEDSTTQTVPKHSNSIIKMDYIKQIFTGHGALNITEAKKIAEEMYGTDKEVGTHIYSLLKSGYLRVAYKKVVNNFMSTFFEINAIQEETVNKYEPKEKILPVPEQKALKNEPKEKTISVPEQRALKRRNDLERMLETPLSFSEIIEKTKSYGVAKCTIEIDLTKLRAKKCVKLIGKGKETKYVKADYEPQKEIQIKLSESEKRMRSYAEKPVEELLQIIKDANYQTIPEIKEKDNELYTILRNRHTFSILTKCGLRKK